MYNSWRFERNPSTNVLDFLKDSFEKEEISHIEKEITEEYDIYFRDLFKE